LWGGGTTGPSPWLFAQHHIYLKDRKKKIGERR